MGDEPETRWSAEASGRAASYDDRWAQMAAQGQSIHGEADFVSGLQLLRSGHPGPASSVLDAGCGTGRVAIELARRGLDVVGVDNDLSMLEKARLKAPALSWVHGDLATLDLGRRFDVVVLAGNVMIYVRPGSEGDVVAALARHLNPGGALVAGFQLQPGRLDLAAYDGHCAAAGLVLDERWATWDRQTFANHDYALPTHRRLRND